MHTMDWTLGGKTVLRGYELVYRGAGCGGVGVGSPRGRNKGGGGLVVDRENLDWVLATGLSGALTDHLVA